MARYTCARCHAVCFTTNGPHLCPDIAARLRRREAQVQAVLDVFSVRGLLDGYEDTKRAIAEAIVQKLANMGVQND